MVFRSAVGPVPGILFLGGKARQQFSLSGAEPALVDLAEKHLIASSWESAWHTPPEGPFGNPDCYGQPSPWIQALGSHCRMPR